MILRIKGNTRFNHTYAQTLCMLFFPGAKFGEDETETPDTPVVELTMTVENNAVYAEAHIKLGDKVAHGSVREEYSDAGTGSSGDKVFTRDRCDKIAAGRAIFNAGHEFFGEEALPPWGILTGVRPTKLAWEFASRGMNSEEIAAALTESYLVSEKKARLCTEVAANEKRLLDASNPRSCSVYISIPFCPTRCAYCSFVSYSTPRLLSLIPDYLAALDEQLPRTFEMIEELGFKPGTIYIGGGTPSVLSEEQLVSLMNTVGACTDVSELSEFTFEAGRPDTVTAGKLTAARAGGVTRVSVNPQTLDNRILEAIGRRHTAEDFFRAFELARASGIPCINTDLIAGLPGCSYDSFSATVNGILALRPENLTVHTFCAKRSAELMQDREQMREFLTGNRELDRCIDYSQSRAAECGYIPYYMYRQKNAVGNFENVGFSLPGMEGLYNIYIMEETEPIFAVGAGSVTKCVDDGGRRIARFAPPKYPYEYLEFAADKARLDGFYNDIIRFYDKNENSEVTK